MPTNVALTGLARDLAARAATGKPIRIGLVGAGEMGTDIVSQVAHMTGIEIGAISELKPGAAAKSVEIAYGNCSIPDDHISPRRSALFMARSVLRDIRDGVRAC
jgi:predicted homoserine dehydrogenase-like protein